MFRHVPGVFKIHTREKMMDAHSKKPHAQHEIARRAQKQAEANEKARVEAGRISRFDWAQEASSPHASHISPHASHIRLLRRREVENRTGLSRSTLYDWMKRGEFPRPVKLGARIVAWRETDIVAWLESRKTRVS
ncbi:helix-turn-helix transcriptional regulator [Mameliella sp.]|uniref:helix-turn-helix transcriptional regulator n=1 Tax=Mameliella sp. TaxID=1924940 RepID=UPI003B50DF25